MTRPDRQFDWHSVRGDREAPELTNARGRLRWIGLGLTILAIVVLGRMIQLNAVLGDAYRAQAARPIVRHKPLPASRGRILSKDGTVLAQDSPVVAVAIEYRLLEDPPDENWLRKQIRRRLSAGQRSDPPRVEQEREKIVAERDAMHRRLAALAGVSDKTWQRRAKRIQANVERAATSVNQRRGRRFLSQTRDEAEQVDSREGSSFWATLTSAVIDALFAPPAELPPPRIVIAEELDHHILAEGLSLEAVAEIEGHPELFPGAIVVQTTRRSYPAGSSAAHLVGYLAKAGPDDLDQLPETPDVSSDRDALVGRAGVERQYDRLLRGTVGRVDEQANRHGRVVSSQAVVPPQSGRDVVLTIDARLQRAAEELLDAMLVRRARTKEDEPAHDGGAIVVMDVRTGGLVALASAPRYDPNTFVRRDDQALRRWMTDPARPLFHRAAQMALPPGSVFKTATAVALLESGTARPEDTVFCRGYLHTPDRLRCYIYGRYGIGHDEIALADALAQSCNVYFFQFAGQMGAEPLVQWAARFGFGRRTGLDLPGESAGQLPTPQSIQRQQQRPWSLADTQALAIGQSSLTATPLQVARMMAAVANGGRLVTPHVASHLGLAGSFQQDDPAGTQLANAEAQPIDALHASTLSALREGLRRTVADPNGTAYQTVRLEHPSIAGKTGTAETGGGRKDHAWLAGYVPAQRPRYAFVVVLEHAGGGAAVAGPVVRRLILRMESLGYFGRTRVTRTDEADRSDKR